MDIWSLNNISHKIIGAAIEVHKELGTGLSEKIYEESLVIELIERGIDVQQQVIVPVYYKAQELKSKYVLDLIVEDRIIAELKAVSEFHAVHTAQIMTYLKLTQKEMGLLINFNVPYLKQGVKRILNGLPNNMVPLKIDSL